MFDSNDAVSKIIKVIRQRRFFVQIFVFAHGNLIRYFFSLFKCDTVNLEWKNEFYSLNESFSVHKGERWNRIICWILQKQTWNVSNVSKMFTSVDRTVVVSSKANSVIITLIIVICFIFNIFLGVFCFFLSLSHLHNDRCVCK